MRLSWFGMVRPSVFFQVDDEGSIPFTRSNNFKGLAVVGSRRRQLNWHFSPVPALATAAKPIVEFRDMAAEIEGIDDLYQDEKDLRDLLSSMKQNILLSISASRFAFNIVTFTMNLSAFRISAPFRPLSRASIL